MQGLQCLALTLAGLALTLPGCARKEPARIFPEEAVASWESARTAGDPEAMAAVFTEDARLMPPNAPTVVGRPAIRTFFRNLFETRKAPADFDEREIIVFGDVTYRQGMYSVELPDGSTEYGKFMQLWKKDESDGTWKLHRMMWSSNGPPMPPPPNGSAPAQPPPS